MCLDEGEHLVDEAFGEIRVGVLAEASVPDLGGEFRAANLLKVPCRAVAGFLSVADIDLVAVVVPAVI